MSLYPQHTLEGGREPNTLIRGGTAPDTTTGAPSLPSELGHGRVSDMGAVSVMVDRACTIKLWYRNEGVGANPVPTWRPGGASADDYTITFDSAAGGVGFFNLFAKARFFLTSDTASVVLYHDGDSAA